MKSILFKLLLFLFFFPFSVFAQQRDLNFYIEKAKENSPFIYQNRNEKRIIQLDLEQLKSIYSRPEVTVEAGVLFAPIISHNNNVNRLKLVSEDVASYSGYDLAATDGGQYQAVLSVKQGLFNKSKLQPYAEKSVIQGQINDNNIELTIHELENVVNHQYLLCLKSEKQAENSHTLIKEVENEIETMQKLVKNAIYKKTDLMLLEIARQNYLQEYETFHSEYKSNIYNLNLLCGIDDESDVQIQEVDFQRKPEVIVNSRFLTSFYLDSLSITNDRKIFDLKYKPQLGLFANTGMNAVYQPSMNRLGFSTGLTLSWTIFDGNQRSIEHQKSEINLQTLNFEKQKSREQNTIQRNFSLNQIKSLDNRISLADNQLLQYDKLLEMYKLQLEQGEVSVMDYKYLIKEISVKKQERLMLEMEKQIVINAYNYWNY